MVGISITYWLVNKPSSISQNRAVPWEIAVLNLSPLKIRKSKNLHHREISGAAEVMEYAFVQNELIIFI